LSAGNRLIEGNRLTENYSRHQYANHDVTTNSIKVYPPPARRLPGPLDARQRLACGKHIRLGVDIAHQVVRLRGANGSAAGAGLPAAAAAKSATILSFPIPTSAAQCLPGKRPLFISVIAGKPSASSLNSTT
jgi:hypothetical protein